MISVNQNIFTSTGISTNSTVPDDLKDKDKKVSIFDTDGNGTISIEEQKSALEKSITTEQKEACGKIKFDFGAFIERCASSFTDCVYKTDADIEKYDNLIKKQIEALKNELDNSINGYDEASKTNNIQSAPEQEEKEQKVSDDYMKNDLHKKYSYENLLKKYPESDFVIKKVELNDGCVIYYVCNKEDYTEGSSSYEFDNIASYWINSDGTIYVNENGKSNVFFERINSNKPEDITSNLHGQLRSTNFDINEFKKDINALNKDNIVKVFSNDKRLLFDLLSDTNIDETDKKECINYIMTKIKEYGKENNVYVDDLIEKIQDPNTKNPGNLGMRLINRLTGDKRYVEANGKIDEPFYQGDMNDCWLLSSIYAISRTPKGRDIIENSLKKNSDGSITVSLQGVGKSYTISKQELISAREYAAGDNDVRAIEMAVQKYFEEQNGEGYTNNHTTIEGNQMYAAYQILTGKGWEAEEKEITDEMIDRVNKENVVTTVASNFGEKTTVKTKEGTEGTLIAQHAYAVVGADEKNVYLVNPWDSSKTLVITREKFKEYFQTIQQIEL